MRPQTPSARAPMAPAEALEVLTPVRSSQQPKWWFMMTIRGFSPAKMVIRINDWPWESATCRGTWYCDPRLMTGLMLVGGMIYDDLRLNHTGSSMIFIPYPMPNMPTSGAAVLPPIYNRTSFAPALLAWSLAKLGAGEELLGPSVETTGKTSPPAGDHVVSNLKMATKRSEFRIWLTSKRDMRSYMRIL